MIAGGQYYVAAMAVITAVAVVYVLNRYGAFGRGVEKEFDAKTANALLVSKSATLVRVAENGNLVLKVKAEKRKKEPKPESEKMSSATPPKEVKLKPRIKIRFTREKQRTAFGGNIVRKRVTLSTATIPRKSVLIVRKTGLKQLPYAMHFVDHSMLDTYDELSFDENYAEPLNPDTGKPEYSPELEGLLAHGIHGQMIEVATQFWRFVLERKHLIFMGLGLLVGLFLSMGLAVIFHAFGGVQINWQPYPPG